MLEAVFGNSPFLGQSLLREPALLRNLCEHGADTVFAAVRDELATTTPASRDRAAMMAALRIARRRIALVVGLADILGLWSIEQVTGALSRFAEAALDTALAHLLATAADAGEIGLPDPQNPVHGSGLIVIGMGKLGALELNYSSDIDLIVLFDPNIIDYHDKSGPQRGYVRIVRDLVRMLEERTSDGDVFRTDLRLRPDPDATPVAISVNAAETYYESLGQNWERAAMIKAHPVAGDREAGAAFLDRLIPFVWRRHLDFAAIQDIHSIKRQIHAHMGHHDIALFGHNIKLGRGGIREIEFFAQTQQLIWGGRDRTLRVLATCDALGALAKAGRIEAQVAVDLSNAYRYLRRVEHRLQIVDDRQTHELPVDQTDMAGFACFLGYDDSGRFADDLTAEIQLVEDHYARLFEDEPELGGGAGNLVFTGAEDDPGTLDNLMAMGFCEGAAISEVVRGWHRGRVRAMRSTRARELLTELMPNLLDALAKTVDPDSAFMRFNDFLANLPAGVQLFSLFHENRGLLNLVAEIMGSAPRLAQHLACKPALLDAVLTNRFCEPLPDAPALRADLATELVAARDFQDELDISRRWVHDRNFQVGLQTLRNAARGNSGALALSNIADAVLAELAPRVEAEFARAHGAVPCGGLAVLAYGKLGGREMTVESDLDLVFIYQATDLNVPSDGERPLTAARYYARLSQRLLNALSAPTSEGVLYEIDMRLRPSGHAGPVASEVSAFESYQRDSAWTWEHMALTRARIVCGPPALTRRIESAIRQRLTARRDAVALRKDVIDMRERVESERATDNSWKLKHVRGGLLDLEFITQYLELRHAAENPVILAGSTTAALRKLGEAGVLPWQTADELVQAGEFYGRLQGLLRLTVGTMRDESRFSHDLRAALARAGDALDFDDLKMRLIDTERRVHNHFIQLIEAPRETTHKEKPAE